MEVLKRIPTNDSFPEASPLMESQISSADHSKFIKGTETKVGGLEIDTNPRDLEMAAMHKLSRLIENLRLLPSFRDLNLELMMFLKSSCFFEPTGTWALGFFIFVTTIEIVFWILSNDYRYAIRYECFKR